MESSTGCETGKEESERKWAGSFLGRVMEDEEYVCNKYPNVSTHHQIQWDGIYISIMGIPGFRMISYLGYKAAWKAAKEFIDTGVQHACGRVVPKGR
jgi:hypothetical protein